MKTSIGKIVLMLLVLMTPLWSHAAAGIVNVTGTVTDENQDPLIGASVSVKGTSVAAVTDVDGNFSLDGVKNDAVIVVSYIGYKTAEFSLNGRTRLEIEMTPDSEILNEVVVIGYGTMDKKELTSAISHISEKDFLKVSSIDPTMMIQGKVPGVSITNTGAGDPNNQASIQIRGVSSRSAGLGPLIVIDGVPGGNVSGTSDLAPLVQQAEMILELFPEAKTVGILYCSAEANSVYQVKVVTDALEAKGITVNAYSFADSNDVAAVTQSACADSDVIYIPTDNTAAACAEAIGNVVEPANVPVIAGEEGICRGCGVATLTINYYDLGRTTGEMAVKILTGEADISTMSIEYFPNPVKKYNPAMAEHFGLTMPEDYEALQ